MQTLGAQAPFIHPINRPTSYADYFAVFQANITAAPIAKIPFRMALISLVQFAF